MAGCLAVANYNFNERNRDNAWYIFESAPESSEIAFSVFFSFYLILNSFIPGELPLMLEVCKFLATFFMQADVTMYSINTQFKELDKLRCNNMNLHEELASIDYIFCDKTGTLTKNELIFKEISVLLDTLQGTKCINAPEGKTSLMAE